RSPPATVSASRRQACRSRGIHEASWDKYCWYNRLNDMALCIHRSAADKPRVHLSICCRENRRYANSVTSEWPIRSLDAERLDQRIRTTIRDGAWQVPESTASPTISSRSQYSLRLAAESIQDPTGRLLGLSTPQSPRRWE